MKHFNMTIEYRAAAHVQQVAYTSKQIRVASSAKALVNQLAKQYKRADRHVCVELLEPNVYGVFVDRLYVAVVRFVEMSYEEYHVMRNEALADMEAHKPVELHGELLMSAAPKGTYNK